METFLKCVHMVACAFLILIVLVQSGRGGGMGAALGAASGQIFGGRGAGSFLSRLTSGAAIVFFCTSLSLSMLASRHASVLAGQQAAEVNEADTGEAGADGDADSDASDADDDSSDDDAAAAATAPEPAGATP
jgi:preprotein translocase subunit SecG